MSACHIKVEVAGQLKRDLEGTEKHKPDDKYKTVKSVVYPFKLVLTSLTGGDRSIGIVR
jgi:hypothetical protein